MKSKEVRSAISFAKKYHEGQSYGAGSFFKLHIMAVYNLIKTIVSDKNTVYMIVAILHDVVEDTNVSIKSIGEKFGLEAMDAIDCITKRNGEKYDDYILRVAENKIAYTVKYADLLSNLKSLPTSQFSSKKKLALVGRWTKALSILGVLVVSGDEDLISR